ncbi:MAG TPA: carbohydrate kinase [Gammaproteobacteria bacterium]|nr:carbohydrate kinase [Gammaproteobacteria bacterium]
MPDIVCFGEALIDFHAETLAEGPPRFVQYAGGAPANVAVAVARLGGRAAYVGMLGRDMFADFLLREFEEAGVDTHYIVRTGEANTGLAFVALDEDGERRFSFYRPPAADLLFRPAHFDVACFDSLAVFHACSNSLTEAAIADTTLDGMQRARRAGALVSFDMNLRPALWPQDADARPRVWAALHEADLVKLCREELAFLAEPSGGEEAVLNRLWQGATRLVVVTDGAAPIRWFTRERQGSTEIYNVRAINTNAAGDAFVGGLLLQLAERRVGTDGLAAFATDDTRLRFAAACGALAVTRHGAFSAMPMLDEVRALMASNA